MGEFLIELLLQPIFEIIYYGFGYVFGSFVIKALSLGLLAPAPFRETNDREFHRSMGFHWFQLTYRRNNQRYVLAEVVALIGIFSLLLCFLFAYWLVIGI